MKLIIMLALSLVGLPVLAQSTSISGGLIYLEKDGVLEAGSYVSLGEAQSIGEALAIECQCAVNMVMPKQTINYIGPVGGGNTGGNTGAVVYSPITTDPTPNTGTGMPRGIPTPNWGWDVDTTIAATKFVNNTDPNCDNSGPGSQAVPYCHLLHISGQFAVFEAGDVVEIAGGPYQLNAKGQITTNGTEANPVIIRSASGNQIRFNGDGGNLVVKWFGQYAIAKDLSFVTKTQHVIDTDYFVLQNSKIWNEEGTFVAINPIVGIKGHDVIIRDSEIFNNRRDPSDDKDNHGLQASSGSYNVWVIDNSIYNNHGDAFQACHGCTTATPYNIFIGRNIMYDNRENAVDLKTVEDVVISENDFYGHFPSGTSGGDNVVLGSNGYNPATGVGPKRVWVLNNTIRDAHKGLRVEGVEDAWIIDNTFSGLVWGFQIDSSLSRDIVAQGNTFSTIGQKAFYAFNCLPSLINFSTNTFTGVGDRELDLEACDGSTLTINNNIFNNGADFRVNYTNYTDINAINALPYATGNTAP